jgi:hypothetical protein
VKRGIATATIVALALAAGAQALGGGGIDARFDRARVPEDKSATATAKCPQGSTVVSGGFAAPDRVYAGGGPYTEILSANRQGKRAWVVRGQNFSSKDGTMYSYAYCADIGPIQVAEGTDTVEDRRDATATARCPQGLTAISGGWAGKNAGGGRPQMIPFLSKRKGTNAWTVGAVNGSFNQSATLTAYAYCAELDPPQEVVNESSGPILSAPSLGVSCKGGRVAISGGFDAATKKGYSASAEVYSSHRKKGGKRWNTQFINGGRDRHLKVYAYCV